MDLERCRPGADLIDLELDVGVGDDGALGDVNAGEAKSDGLVRLCCTVVDQLQIAAGEINRTRSALLDIIQPGHHPFLEYVRGAARHRHRHRGARGVPVGVGDGVAEGIRARESGSRGIGEGAVAIVDDGAGVGARGAEGGDRGGTVAMISRLSSGIEKSQAPDLSRALKEGDTIVFLPPYAGGA